MVDGAVPDRHSEALRRSQRKGPEVAFRAEEVLLGWANRPNDATTSAIQAL
jgi:hypothetical protein